MYWVYASLNKTICFDKTQPVECKQCFDLMKAFLENRRSEEWMHNYLNVVLEHLYVLRACSTVRLTKILKEINTAGAKCHFNVAPVEQSTANKTIEMMDRGAGG